MLTRVATVLTKSFFTLLPTAVDAGVVLFLLFKNYIKSPEMGLQVAAAAKLAAAVTGIILFRKNKPLWTIPGVFIQVAWTAYEVYLYRTAKESIEKTKQDSQQEQSTKIVNKQKEEVDSFFESIQPNKYNTHGLTQKLKGNRDLFKQKNPMGANILHVAADKGCAEFIKWMINADPELFNELNVDFNGRKPLYLAILTGKKECVQVLVGQDPKAALNEAGPGGKNAKEIALAEDQVDILKWMEEEKLLLQNDETVDQFFQKAVDTKSPTTKVLDWLYTKYVTEEQKKGALETALNFALRKGHAPFAWWVQAKNQEFFNEKVKNFALLSEMVTAGHKTLLEELHRRVPEVIQQKGQNGGNLLSVAILFNQLDIAQFLYTNDAKLFAEASKQNFSNVFEKEVYTDIKIWYNNTAEKIANKERWAQESKKANINHFFSELEKETTYSDQAIAATCQSKPDFFDLENNGERVLHIAARKGRTNLIKWLKLMGKFSDQNKPNKDGWKPLHLAVKHGKLDSVKELYNNDPNLLQEDLLNIGSPRSIAFTTGHVDIVAWLDEKKYLLQPNETYDNLFDDVLKLKITNTNALNWLHGKIKDDQQDKALEKALITSVKSGHLAIAAWVDEKDKSAIKNLKQDGHNLMSFAIREGQVEIAKWLDSKDKSLFGELDNLEGVLNQKRHPEMYNWVAKRALGL